LGECLHLDSGTLTPLLKRMELAGFVTRSRDPEDERRVLVALTPSGQSLREAARSIPEQLRHRLRLSEQAAGELRGTVNQLIGLLSQP